MSKLHVPAPQSHEDDADRFETNLVMVLGLLACIASLVYLAQGDRAAPNEPNKPLAPVQRDIYDELADQRELSVSIGKLSQEELQARDWSDADRRAVFRFGPRPASEVVCSKLIDDIKADKLSKAMRLELEKTLDRRTEFGPWTCLSRLFLNDELPAGGLLTEMTQWWGEVNRHVGNERIPITVIEEFRSTREKPPEKFLRFLRLCALDFEWGVHAECHKLLYQMSPQQGHDLLEMIEIHWADGGTSRPEMALIIAGLGYLARNGQPYNWRVKETPALPDYDVDFRQATVGYLCRMMNTPTPKDGKGGMVAYENVAESAGEQLRSIGLVGARAYEEKLLMRWREACRIAFGGGANEERTTVKRVPVLAVWDGDPQNPPDYSIAGAIERGACNEREGHPRWYCLAELWTDEERSIDQAVYHVFVRTKYMEWEDAWRDTHPRP